jgi:hypothetical protein
MKKFPAIAISILMLTFSNSCFYGVNEKTSEIGTINWVCDWDRFEQLYSIERLMDSAFIRKLPEFAQMPFPTKVLYFEGAAHELIGISENHYQIRYVYNPRIADQVLDGLSPQLPEAEKQRIQRSMDSILRDFGCRRN